MWLCQARQFMNTNVTFLCKSVNMAKALIKTNTLECDDLTDEENPHCAMEVILRSIITNQNAQIQTMRGVLEAKNAPPENDCVVEAYSDDVPSDSDDVPSNSDGLSDKVTGLNKNAALSMAASGKVIVAAMMMLFM